MKDLTPPKALEFERHELQTIREALSLLFECRMGRVSLKRVEEGENRFNKDSFNYLIARLMSVETETNEMAGLVDALDHFLEEKTEITQKMPK